MEGRAQEGLASDQSSDCPSSVPRGQEHADVSVLGGERLIDFFFLAPSIFSVKLNSRPSTKTKEGVLSWKFQGRGESGKKSSLRTRERLDLGYRTALWSRARGSLDVGGHSESEISRHDGAFFSRCIPFSDQGESRKVISSHQIRI